MEERRKAAAVLAFLPLLFAELITGSTPPLAMLNPIFLLLLLGLYGGSAVIIRDAVVRLHKGPATLIAFGLAFGVFEEALVVRSWFDPEFANVQILGSYGWVGGINVVWAAWTAPWQALLAVAIPAFLVRLVWPQFNGVPLLARRDTALCAAGPTAVFLLSWSFPNAYVPATADFAIAAAACASLVALGLVFPSGLLRPRGGSASHQWWQLAAFGGVWSAADFLLVYLGPATGMHWALVLGMLVLTAATGGFALYRLLPASGWERPLFLFFAGVLGFFSVRALLVGWSLALFPLPVLGAGLLVAVRMLYGELWPETTPAAPVPSAAGSPPND